MLGRVRFGSDCDLADGCGLLAGFAGAGVDCGLIGMASSALPIIVCPEGRVGAGWSCGGAGCCVVVGGV